MHAIDYGHEVSISLSRIFGMGLVYDLFVPIKDSSDVAVSRRQHRYGLSEFGKRFLSFVAAKDF